MKSYCNNHNDMNIFELNKNYSAEELTTFPGDNKFRFDVFSPLFKNLFETKVVYHERFTGIVILDEINISPEMFEATAIPYLIIEKGSRLDRFFPKKAWKFGAKWSSVRLIGNCLSSMYGGWNIWCDPETVKEVENMVLEKNYEAALNLTLYKDL